MAQYGDRLVCVRYRQDPEQQRRLTTVELIVDERPLPKQPGKISAETVVWLQVEYGEINVGKAVKAAGGIWDGHQKLWKIPYGRVEELGMLDRIVPSTNEKEGKGQTGGPEREKCLDVDIDCLYLDIFQKVQSPTE